MWGLDDLILALTFSREAPANMRAQVEKLLNETSEVQVSTFHSFCEGVIRDNADKCGVHPDFSIFEDATAQGPGRGHQGCAVVHNIHLKGEGLEHHNRDARRVCAAEERGNHPDGT